MKKVFIAALSLTALILIICVNDTPAAIFADNGIDLIVEEPQNSEKICAIGIAQDLCAKEGLSWDDVTIKNLGDGRWRVVIVSVEQGRTGVIEVNAVKKFVVSKSFK